MILAERDDTDPAGSFELNDCIVRVVELHLGHVNSTNEDTLRWYPDVSVPAIKRSPIPHTTYQLVTGPIGAHT